MGAVFAITSSLKPHMDELPVLVSSPRLYAYPTEPDPPAPGGFIILDSGAWGMSKRGRAIDEYYMHGLAAYYQQYQHRWPGQVQCIAPDIYLDPKGTVENYKVWRQDWQVPVVPVIQFEHVGKLDVCVADWQARFYAHSQPAWIAISNPGLRASQAALMVPILQIVRAAIGATWIHCLGCGWDPLDAAGWLALGFDSIDSVAYLEDARRGRQWRVAGREWSCPGTPWPQVAEANAIAVLRTCEQFSRPAIAPVQEDAI